MTLSVAHKIPVEHLSFPGLCPVTDAVADLARLSAEEQRGAVVSRRKVFDFVLDLIGFVPDEPLYKLKLLEPSIRGWSFVWQALG